MATSSFLSEFPETRTEDWEKLIRESVTGPEYASRMVWRPEEGLAVRPYYRSEDLAGIPYLHAAPGEFPFIRGVRDTGDWRICEEVDQADPKDANAIARDAVSAGAEEIGFCGTRIESASDLALLLSGLDDLPVYLEGVSASTVRLVGECLHRQPHAAAIATDLAPLDDLSLSMQVIANAPEGLRAFAIRADSFHERGAGAIEELAFALSAGVNFIAELRDCGIPLEQILRSIGFSFAIGPEFFVQISKLRAFRMIWAEAVQAFGGAQEQAKAVVRTRTANWNETIYDPQVNVLRATTEAVSAILGGADSVTVSPFDRCHRTPDLDSKRLARNTQLILKREAFLSRVADPVGGSYLIETLTHAIAAKAWTLFQELEAAGGFRQAVADGIVESVLQQRACARELEIACRRVVLTGTNRFANASEKALDRIERAPDEHVRAGAAFERVRLRTEQRANTNGHAPRVLLAEIGDAKMRAARAQFAAEFLACGGFQTTKKQFESAEQIARADADLFVLCSSDADYDAITSKLMPMLRERKHRAKVVIAGNPEGAQRLSELGITAFIHMRSNAVEVLSAIQQQLGIEE